MVEADHAVTAAFQELGYVAVRHGHRALGTALTNGVPRQIRHLQISGIWVQMPKSGEHTARSRHSAAVADLCLWARLCTECGVPFMLFGVFGAMKRDPQVEIAVNNGTLHWTYHRMCHFGLKVDCT